MMIPRFTYRLFLNRACFILVCVFLVLGLLPFFMIIWELLYSGIKHINFGFFFETSPSATDAILAKMGVELIPGGILNGIFGSFVMIVIAVVFAVPLGILSGICISENQHRRFAVLIQCLTGILQGIPSIIIGVIVYLSIVRSLHGFSAFAGGVSLAIVMLPVITFSTLKVLRALPTNLKEAGMALGGSYTAVMLRIILPAAGRGLTAGVLIAISRALGETAPLILTVLGTSMINWNIYEPTNSISLLIWNFFNNSNMIDLLWSTSLFLFLIVLFLNIIAKYIIRNMNSKISFYE